MKKHRYLFCFTILLIGTSALSQARIQKSFLVCGDSKVLLIDYEGSRDTIPKVSWNWDAHSAKDIPEEYRLKKFNSMDDCKPDHNGERVLVASSSGAIAIIEKKTRKVMFYANVPMAHSIEMLPSGFVAAAASTAGGGNRIMLFNINKSDELLFSDSLYSGHGVVWDKNRESLFALGYDVLREYKLVTKGKARLTLQHEWELPHKGGHDLQMAPGGNDLFLTIEKAGAWEFNLKTSEFGRIKGFTGAPIIKSIGKNDAGQFIYTVPEESWWTYHVKFSNPNRSFAFPGMHVYKARWFSK